MRKKTFRKAVALVVCLVFISLSVPALNSADKKSSKFDIRLLLKKPATWISSILPIFSSIFDNGNSSPKNTNQNKSAGKVRLTGGLPSYRPSGDN